MTVTAKRSPMGYSRQDSARARANSTTTDSRSRSERPTDSPTKTGSRWPMARRWPTLRRSDSG